MLSNVALVETDHQAAKSVQRVLEKAGCAVTTYSDYIDLFHGVLMAAPEIIILDLRVWTVREQALAKVLRERLQKPATRFVLVTDNLSVGKEALEVADAVLPRTFSPADLIQAISGDFPSPYSATIS
jgi:DNA-binding response OmpR family regulator